MRGWKILGELSLMALLPVVAVLVLSRLSGGLGGIVMVAIILAAEIWTMHGVDRYLSGR